MTIREFTNTMINENITIEDNYLKLEEINKLQEIMIGGQHASSFPWNFKYRYYDNTSPIAQNNGNDLDIPEDDLDKFQFIHTFYDKK